MDTMTAAFRYINAGYAVIPVWRDQRKNPHLSTFKPYLDRLPTHAEWRKWSDRWPRCNVALITGYWGLVALDFDDKESYRCWCDTASFGLRGQTWTVATRRGYHVWFSLADGGKSRNYVCRCGQGHEVLLRSKGGYCVVPPSIHHTGARYQTVHKVLPFGLDSAEQMFGDSWVEKQRKKRATANTVSHSPQFGNVRIEHLVPPVKEVPNGRGAYQAYCPFHDDGKPSAWVNIEQQRFGCNACWPGLWWDTANVYAMMKNISNGEALLMLKNNQAEAVS